MMFSTVGKTSWPAGPPEVDRRAAAAAAAAAAAVSRVVLAATVARLKAGRGAAK